MLSIAPGRSGSVQAEAKPVVVTPHAGADDPWGLAPTEPKSPAPPALPVPVPAPGAGARRRGAIPKAVVATAVALAAVATIATAAWVARAMSASTVAPAPRATGTLILSSHPPGAEVVVDGTARGLTPLALQLPAGAHEVVLSAAGQPSSERLHLTTEAGETASQHVVFAAPPATTGAVAVEATRTGAEVLVDGLVAGVTPLTLQDVAPGPHEIAVRMSGRTVTRTVDVQPGITTSLVVGVPAAGAAPLSGWLQFATPFPVEVYEQERLLGVSRSDRIMVSAGAHTLDLVNDALGFRHTTTVAVRAGETVAVPLEAPLAPVSINALPWAEVEIEGQPYGETPIGTLLVPIGDRTVTLRHPTLGVRAETFTVRQNGPNRLSVDMRR